MSLATLLLALLTATDVPTSDRAAVDAPVLLDFHAEWCAPCRQVRGSVKELVRRGYPVRSIDIDRQREVAARYGVDAVPTFIVVDSAGRELDRTQGLQSFSALAQFYRNASARAQPPDNANAHVGARERPRRDPDEDDDEPARPQGRATRVEDPDDPTDPEPRRAASPVNPHPAETVVRIKIIGPHSTGFGSGTIIHSTSEESLILTCAHIFKLEGRRQASPRDFPRKIVIDLFDGKLRGTSPAQVGYLESVEGKAVDYDFNRDVGLIRIRPGRKLPASRVVPDFWEPKSPMKMLTLGCSEGNDATAWYTKILNPRMQGLAGNSAYEAIECWNAPKQGRSGGGLFTTDFYIAGVCNFAEPRGNHGLYATPRSIYSILDRNKLMALYAPVDNKADAGTLLADDRPPSRSPAPRPIRPRRTLTPVARAQSPDSDERKLRRAVGGPDEVTLPHPKLLGIPDPINPGDPAPQAASGPTRRTAWHPIPTSPAPGAPRVPEPTDLKVLPSANQIQDRSTPVAAPAKASWHAVRTEPTDRRTETSGN